MTRLACVFAAAALAAVAGCDDDKDPAAEAGARDAVADTRTDAGTDATTDAPTEAATETGAETAGAVDIAGDQAGDGLADQSTSDSGDSGADVGSDGPALPGVTCMTKRRQTLPDGGCTQVTTVEQNVRFWLSPYLVGVGAHPESGMGTSSPGILLFFNRSEDYPGSVFTATDMTFTLYRGATTVGPGEDGGTAHRMGDRIDFTMNAGRAGGGGTSCPVPVPLVWVTCSGSTTLGR